MPVSEREYMRTKGRPARTWWVWFPIAAIAAAGVLTAIYIFGMHSLFS